MPIQLKVEVKDKEVRALLARLVKRVDDLTPVNREIGEIILEGVKRNIAEGRSAEGDKWKPSLRATLDGGTTLRDTGAHLVSSLNVQPERDRVRVGTAWEFAHVHQFGAVITPKKAKALRFRLANGQWVTTQQVVIPARPYMGIRGEDWGEIREAITDYLSGR